MKKLNPLFFTFAFCLLPFALFSQAPQGFNYQAVARDNTGQVLKSQALDVKIGILSGSATDTLLWEEIHNVTTNEFGLFTIQIGTETKTGGSILEFSAIDWNSATHFLNVHVYAGTNYVDMGTSQLLSVPYALSASSVSDLKNLNILGPSDQPADSALFEVKNKDGQTVFAVYNEGVRVYVDTVGTKGLKGGFAVGGFSSSKGSTEYLRVTPDSVRIYVSGDDNKGRKGGFAVGGYSPGKGLSDSYFNISGKSEAEIIDPSDSRILWYPKKEAFLTGRVLIESPDSVGTNSIATGYESKAIGNWSQALGYQTIARGDYSTSIGKNSVTQGINTFAFGNQAQAIGEDSYALGTGAQALGNKSFAFGSVGLDSAGIATGQTSATHEYAFALGFGSQAIEQGAFAIGFNDTASGPYSLAMGYKTMSSGYFSTTIGYRTTASARISTAMGFETKASGDASTALGNRTTASGHSSIAMGFQTISSFFASTAMGSNTMASGNSSTAMGSGTSASGLNSTAMGGGTTASGNMSTAMGNSTMAGEQSSTAMGDFTTASGHSSTAMGHLTTAISFGSTAMGIETTASGDASTAMGWKTIASGINSIATGNETKAKGDNSTALGGITIARSYNSFVIGSYNDTLTTSSLTSWVGTDPLFVIGNGITETNRSNAMTVLKNGNIGLGTMTPQGTLDVNGSIYQRGIVLHADYVFENEYGLESIEEHSKYMWENKHLSAVPKASKDEDGNDVVEWGARSKGVLEELEKAHVYIDQMNSTMKEQQKQINTQQKEINEQNRELLFQVSYQQEMIENQQSEIDQLKEIMNRLLKAVEPEP